MSKCSKCNSLLVSLYCRNGASGKRWIKIGDKYCKKCKEVKKMEKCPYCNGELVYAEVSKEHLDEYMKGNPVPFPSEDDEIQPILKCDTCKRFRKKIKEKLK